MPCARKLKNLLSYLLLLLAAGLITARSAEAEPPNIVVIMADDIGYSDLGCFGGEIATPNLDRLAMDGLRFTNFYSENMCWVSRAALLTGVYHKTSMFESAIHPRCVTLAEALKANGYQTRMSGKWHLAGKPYEIFPGDRGFDDFYGILGGSASYYAPAFLTRNRDNVDLEAHEDPDYYLTDAISHEADRMIREADTRRPLFLYVAYTAAHWPLHARESEMEAYRGRYASGWDRLREQRLGRMKELGIVRPETTLSARNPNVPAWDDELHPEWQQRRMEVYAAQITAMDRGIGNVLDGLRDTGRLDNTLIFFTIDNGGCHVEYTPDRKGDYLPERTRDGRPMRPGNLPEILPGVEDTYQSYGHGWANASNTPYRLFKQFDHEGGIRTPMIAHWPEGISQPGRLVKSVSHLIDIMPTILEVTETSVPETSDGHRPIGMDGHSLASGFQGPDPQDHLFLYFEHAQGRALRSGSWKLVAEREQPWELYELSKDPTEESNLAAEMPEKLQELEAIWQAESKRLADRAKLE